MKKYGRKKGACIHFLTIFWINEFLVLLVFWPIKKFALLILRPFEFGILKIRPYDFRPFVVSTFRKMLNLRVVH